MMGDTAATGAQRPRRMCPVFGGELQRDVAAERVARDRDRRQSINLAQLVDDVRGVGGQPGVKQADRQLLGVAAVALVEAHDVQAAAKRLGGEAAHVVGLARSVEPVQRDERRMLPRARMPVAVRGDARVGVDVEVPA